MKDARLTNPLTVATGLLNTAFDYVEGFMFPGKKGGGGRETGQPAPVTEDGQHSSEEEEEEEEAYVIRACTCTLYIYMYIYTCTYMYMYMCICTCTCRYTQVQCTMHMYSVDSLCLGVFCVVCVEYGPYIAIYCLHVHVHVHVCLCVVYVHVHVLYMYTLGGIQTRNVLHTRQTTN